MNEYPFVLIACSTCKPNQYSGLFVGELAESARFGPRSTRLPAGKSPGLPASAAEHAPASGSDSRVKTASVRADAAFLVNNVFIVFKLSGTDRPSSPKSRNRAIEAGGNKTPAVATNARISRFLLIFRLLV